MPLLESGSLMGENVIAASKLQSMANKEANRLFSTRFGTPG